MKQLVIFLFFTFSIAGCATHGTRAAMTSGEIGCPTSEIKVSDGDMGWTTDTWTAICRGKTFFCTYTSSLNLSSRTQCKEEISLSTK